MDKVSLLLRFKEEPSQQEKDLLKSQLFSTLEIMCPDSEKHCTSGHGSWWIFVWCQAQGLALWLFEESASWAVSRALDKVLEQVSSKNNNMDIAKEQALEKYVDRGSEMQGKIKRLAEKIEVLSAIQRKTGAVEVTFSEWSEEAGEGRSLSISNEEDSTKCHIYQTDSKDAFEAFISRR